VKIFPALLLAAGLAAPAFALDSAALSAVAAKFTNPSGEAQYAARIELNGLIDKATAPETGDSAAVSKLIVLAIQSNDTPLEAKKYLLRALGRIGDGEAVAALIPLLSDANALLKEEARTALESINDPKAAAALEAALAKTQDKRELIALANSLASQKSPSSVSALAPLVINKDPAIAKAALQAIAKIGGAPATETLLKAHASSMVSPALKPDIEMSVLLATPEDAKSTMQIYQISNSETVKSAAFLTLMKTAPADAKPAIIEGALKSPYYNLRHEAIAAAIRAALPSLTASLSQNISQMPLEDRLIVLANIHTLKPTDAAEKIALSQIASADETERIAAISALGQIPTKASFAALLQAVGAREPWANQAASAAIATVKFPDAEATLLTMLKGASSPDKILALKAIVTRPLPEIGMVLINIITGSDEAAAKEAMKSFYFTASLDDLRALCAEATSTADADKKKSLNSIASRIATRINTEEAAALAKSLQ